MRNIGSEDGNGRGQHASCFNQVSQSAGYKQDTKSVSLAVCGGSYGGGSECLVVDALRKTCFCHSGFAKYTESQVAETLRAAGGDLGGGSENLVLHAELGTNQDQALFVLNDQGGSVMNVSYDKTGTLRAEDHGHPPIVFGISAYDSNAMKSSNPHSGIYEAQTSRTLDLNGGNPSCNQGGGVLILQRRFNDVQVHYTDKCPTLEAAMGQGGNNAPIVLAAFEGNGIRPSHYGAGINDGKQMYTLNSTEVHGVIYELPK